MSSKKRGHRTRKPVWFLVIAHVLALGVALVLYALPHHVIPRAEKEVGITSSRESAALLPPEEHETPEPSAVPTTVPTVEAIGDGTPVPTPEPTPVPTAEPVGSFRNKFADKFTDGEVINTKKSYRSANLNVTLSERFIESMDSKVYLVDIYVADISCLRTVFARDKYGRAYTEGITKVAKRTKSVFTMNGDYYGARSYGAVIRNGKLYRDQKVIRDVAVLYWDGRMKTMTPKQFNARKAMQQGAYQSWYFGPRLLDSDGKALTSFNVEDSITRSHPRSVIGYFEPGHYCFVTVDGRIQTSSGARLRDLAKLMESLGCKAAYNLDGGQTTQLAKGAKVVNHPTDGGRDSSDYIILVDEVKD